MTTTMSALDWLLYIFLGGTMGILGQGMRTFAGLKKANDEADLRGVEFSDVFDRSILLTSLALGFVAGAAAALALAGTNGSEIKGAIDVKTLLGFAVAGYAGSDFIEAFVKSTLPSQFKKPATTNLRHIPSDLLLNAKTIAAEINARDFPQPEAATAAMSFNGHVRHVIARVKNLDDDQVDYNDTLKKHRYTTAGMPRLATRLTNYFNEIGQPLRSIVHESELNPEQKVVDVCAVVRRHA